MRLEHGGDLYTAGKTYPGTILDFSVNLNPLGAPPAVLQAAAEAVRRAEEYPDPACRALRQAIGAMHGVPQEWVLCGNGATELLFRLVQALRPGRTLLTAPAFSEYEAALHAAGCPAVFHPLSAERNFEVTDAILDALTPETELVLLCNPNNPTGRLLPSGLLPELLRRCRKFGCILAVDECFLPLATGEEPLLPLLAQAPHLLLLRAFTKTHAIPGLRLGYCLCGNPALLKRMEDCGPSWNVSVPAQAAGLACCQCPDWPARGRDLLREQRPQLQSGLERLGLTVIPGEANFLLFRAGGNGELKQRLLTRGILLRQCADYRGLGPDWYRTTVRRAPDNRRLLEELEVCLWQK